MTRTATAASTRRGVSGLLGAALVAAVISLVPAPATSATPLLPEVEVTDAPARVETVASAVGPDGSFVVAWAERADGSETESRVRVATRAPGAAGFSSPVDAPQPGGLVRSLVLVVDGTGATTLVWELDETTGPSVEAVRRPPGASGFGPPRTLAESGYGVTGVGDAEGRVTLAWVAIVDSELGKVDQVHSATWEPATAEWSYPTVITPAGRLTQLHLAVDGAGAVTAAWAWQTVSGLAVQTRTRPARSAVFGTAHTHSATDGWAPYVDLASNAAGATVLVWWGQHPLGSDYVLRMVDRAPGAASFGHPVVVATVGAAQVRGAPLVALDGVGTVTVAWTLPQSQSLWVATGRIGGTPTTPVLAATSVVGAVSLSSSAGSRSGEGATLLAWTEGWREATRNTPARAAYRPAGGEFGEPVDLSAAIVGVQDTGVVAAVDEAGDAHVAWLRTRADEASQRHVHARTLDGTGPGLHDVAVPAHGTAGAPVTMSAAATDLWSGPASILWDYGDGVTGTGRATSHVYAAAGSYLVRVSATDGAGNTTRLFRSIVVGPAAGPDSTAPVLSRPRLVPGLLPTGEGARLRLTSSERSALAGVVQRRREGRWRAVGTKRWSIQAGANDKTFYGKTSERRLRSGTYRVRLTATDPAGNTSAITTIRFRVDRG